MIYYLYDMNQITKQTEERNLCPICKDGMKCASLVFHARYWDVRSK